MKNKILTLTCLIFIGLSVYCQTDKIIYSFPENIQNQFYKEIDGNKQYYDTSKYVFALHVQQSKDTLTCFLVRVERNEKDNRRSLLPLVKLSNRVVRLNNNIVLPVFFDSDLAFSQWPMGLHGSFFQVKFSLSGQLYKTAFE